jgi:uncharacterized membrane protein
MRRLVFLLFPVAIVGVLAYILTTIPSLPDRVASHFGANGLANGYMSRDGYRTFIVAFALGVPLFVVAVVGLLPRAFPGAINIRDRDYWFAPERRDNTLGYLFGWACSLGALLALFIAAIHAAVMVANAYEPPRLPTALFWIDLVAFGVGMIVWIAAIADHFRRPT